MPKNSIILAGTSGEYLAKKIANKLGASLGHTKIEKFSDGETYVRIMEPVKDKKVFVIQSGCAPANDHLIELLFLLDAARRQQPKTLVAILPFYPYRRQERISTPGEAISADIVAKTLECAGADEVISLNLHSTTIEKFFTVPVLNLRAWQPFIDFFKKTVKDFSNFTTVAPDEGAISRSKLFSRELGTSLAIISKNRPDHDETEIETIVGEVKGENIIIVDDEINTAGTMVNTINALKEAGAQDIYLCCIHAVLSGEAVTRLRQCPIKKIIISDTIKLPTSKKLPNLEIVSVVPVIARVIKERM